MDVTNQRPMPTIKEYEYCAMSHIQEIKKEEEQFLIALLVNKKQIFLQVSLPQEGGVRICTDEQGFFKPKGTQKLRYFESSDGTLKVVAEDTTYLELIQHNEDWEIEIGNSKKKLLTLKGSELFLGFENDRVAGVRFKAALQADEVIYGTGERYNSINQVGTKLRLWNLDAGYHGSDDDFKSKVESYNNVPLIHSTKGYSLFFNSTYCIDADFGVADASKYELTAYGPKFDFYFWTGTPMENMASYTALTGRVLILPRWAYSYWLGSGAKVWKGEDNGEKEYLSIVQEYIDGYKQMDIHNIVALYGEKPITTDKVVYEMLRKANIRMLMWNPCYFPLDTITGNLQTDEKNSPVVFNLDAPDESMPYGLYNTFIDYSHPKAKEFVKTQYEQYVNMGLHGLMVDMGERIPENTIFHNGLHGDEMHNLSAYYYVKTIHDAFLEMMNDKHDFVLFERSGCAGIQAYSASFTGDQPSKIWGLKQQIHAGLTMSASGCTIWGGDIGGYGGRPSFDSYLRWIQFSTFEPLMREHGNARTGNNPWYYGKEAEEIFKTFYWLRENMIDMIYSSALNARMHGTLMTTPLLMAYPEDKELYHIEDEYLFCDNLLVCPVTENDVVTREVTLPNGTWYDLWTGVAIDGGKTMMAAAPQDKIPVYLKSGALMAVTVADSLNLTEPIIEETAKKAIVVTPPEENTEYEVWDENGETSMIYQNEVLSENRFCITANNKAVNHILVYGTLVEDVIVDNLHLSENIDYYFDGRMKTVIILPDGNWKKVEIVKKSILVEEINEKNS